MTLLLLSIERLLGLGLSVDKKVFVFSFVDANLAEHRAAPKKDFLSPY